MDREADAELLLAVGTTGENAWQTTSWEAAAIAVDWILDQRVLLPSERIAAGQGAVPHSQSHSRATLSFDLVDPAWMHFATQEEFRVKLRSRQALSTPLRFESLSDFARHDERADWDLETILDKFAAQTSADWLQD